MGFLLFSQSTFTFALTAYLSTGSLYVKKLWQNTWTPSALLSQDFTSFLQLICWTSCLMGPTLTRLPYHYHTISRDYFMLKSVHRPRKNAMFISLFSTFYKLLLNSLSILLTAVTLCSILIAHKGAMLLIVLQPAPNSTVICIFPLREINHC